ncbi:MAG: dephospho-CoA kinase [Betaproteobacteria bacterium]|nr:dephospho-CoA kinase [Betaproteobacteria bacterium]
MFIIGLTGGIGSGKSTVAAGFAALGVEVVDTDAIAHELSTPGGAAIPALRAAFGDRVLRADGGLDRPAMRSLVFSDREARRKLENILHPMIKQEALRRCAAASSPYVLLMAPLLIETGNYRADCRRILVVDCGEAVRRQRVAARDGLSAAEIDAVIASQATRDERLRAADDTIGNEGDRQALEAQISALHRRYLEEAALSSGR